MFCSNCGKKNIDDGFFCIQCGKPLQQLPGTPDQKLQGIPEVSGESGSPFFEAPAPQSQYADTTPRANHKGRAGLVIAITAGVLVLIAALLAVFLWVIPMLNKPSGDRPADATEAEEFSLVGFWVNEEIPGAVEFKSNDHVVVYSDDDHAKGTYEYDEEEEEGVIYLDSGDIEFSVSGDEIDIRGAGDFERVEDEDFDVREFMEDNSTSDMTTTAMPTVMTSSTTAVNSTVTIGVSMPTRDLQRWYQDGQNMKSQLEYAGYIVDLQYANNDVATQVSQIENMIAGGASILVIASIDGSSLGTVLAAAKEKSIPVIAYDRLIYNTDACSYYATFDNYMVGTIQGQYVIDTLKLDTAAGPFNMEFFGGAPDDNNALYFYQGEYDILKPYIDSGKLVVVSGQVDFNTVSTVSWKTENAEVRMDNLLASYYTGGTRLDVVVCANDSTALGVEKSLDSAGYKVGENWPIITGQDCDLANIRNILVGKQSMSVFKDTRTLVTKTVEIVTAIVNKSEVPINNTQDYDNGNGIVPTFLCESVYADATNYQQLLVDTGYYTADQFLG